MSASPSDYARGGVRKNTAAPFQKYKHMSVHRLSKIFLDTKANDIFNPALVKLIIQLDTRQQEAIFAGSPIGAGMPRLWKPKSICKNVEEIKVGAVDLVAVVKDVGSESSCKQSCVADVSVVGDTGVSLPIGAWKQCAQRCRDHKGQAVIVYGITAKDDKLNVFDCTVDPSVSKCGKMLHDKAEKARASGPIVCSGFVPTGAN